jgi:hypothetical protein
MQATSPARGLRPGDRFGIARELQRELKRVGCYHGEISGVWTPATRSAVRSFTERINAALPDEPDVVLLALVQAQEAQVCGVACPAGQALTADGRCLPSAILDGRRAQPAARVLAPAQPVPAITLQSTARAGAADALPSGEPRPPVPPAVPGPVGVQMPLPGAAPATPPGQAKPPATQQTVFDPAVFRRIDKNGF